MRRRDLMWLAGLTAPALCLSLPALASERELRIGVQKYGSLILLKERGLLEKRLAPLGWTIAWTEFPGGPQLLEALNVGAIDFGTTGEAPPIFAQAAGAPLVYVGYEPPAPRGEAILVPVDSPIKGVADLKGRKVAFNKGSNVQYLVVRALEAARLVYGDIEPVYLPPADARAAFERGAVDAWAIWDPFLAAAQAATGARALTDGTGLVQNHQFYLAAQPFAAAQPALIQGILADLDGGRALGCRQPRRSGCGAVAEDGHSHPGARGGARTDGLRREAPRRGGGGRAAEDRRHVSRSRPAAEAYRGAAGGVEDQHVSEAHDRRPLVPADARRRPLSRLERRRPRGRPRPICARSRRPPTIWAISACCCRPGAPARIPGWSRRRLRP